MSEGAFLRDLVVLLGAALPIVIIFERLNVPAVVGFLVTGVLIGPHGAGLIANSADVDSLAELGLVLLLFVVGLELSFTQLMRLGRIIVCSGTLQVLVTAGVGFVVAAALGLRAPQSLLIGFLVVHSSTAIVLKVLGDRGEVDAPHGRIAVGIALIQDLSLVPMVLFTRLLVEPLEISWLAIGSVLVKAGVAVGCIIVAARFLIPALLRQVVGLRSRELFTGLIVFLCLGAAWLAAQLGLSLALGALIAGLIISESEYSHQAVADILPFRDAFNSIFFISIGMLVKMDVLIRHAPTLGALAATTLLLKMLIIVAVVLPLYRSIRVAVLTAASLAAVGELSFVLARLAAPTGLLSATQYETFVAVAVLSMVVSPFLINAAPALAERLQARSGTPQQVEDVEERPVRNHVVIIGYGLNGRNLAHVLRQTGIRYVILEIDPDTVAATSERGEPIVFGDATRPEVLRKAGVPAAHVIVVAISDPVATRRIVALARHDNPHVPIIVRTRYVAEIDDLLHLGATEVIPEEFETSVEIFAHVLRRLRVPRNVITLQVELIRTQGYSMLRGLQLPRQTLDQLGDILAATTTETFLVPKSSPAAGRTVRDLQLRRTTGVTIIAVVRNGTPFTNPEPEQDIAAGDILVMLGSHAQLDQALIRLAGQAPEVPA